MDKSLEQYLYPRASYHGEIKPEQLIFNANLQEFAQRVGYISGLHTGGRLSSDAAIEQISQLWHELQSSHRKLKIELSEDQR